MDRTNLEGRTHIHRSDVLATMSRSPHAGSTKNNMAGDEIEKGTGEK